MTLPVHQSLTTDPELARTMIGVCRPFCDSEGLAAAEQAGWSPELWERLSSLGLTGVGISEDAGGSGGTDLDAAELVRLTGYLAAPVPLAESAFVSGRLLETMGMTLPAEPVAVSPATELTAARTSDGWRVRGRATGVVGARGASLLLAEATRPDESTGAVTVLVPLHDALVDEGTGYAGEPHDTVWLEGVTPLQVSALKPGTLKLRGALARSLQLAGALERVLEMSLDYAKEREQFGQPILRFQAVAHQVALLGEATAQARMAAEIAVVTGEDDDARAAKVVAGEAATRGALIAHQIHGAIGFTREHHLHYLTRRLWTWRDEFGPEAAWAEELGRSLTRRDADLWGVITR